MQPSFTWPEANEDSLFIETAMREEEETAMPMNQRKADPASPSAVCGVPHRISALGVKPTPVTALEPVAAGAVNEPTKQENATPPPQPRKVPEHSPLYCCPPTSTVHGASVIPIGVAVGAGVTVSA